jgi:hypothetical protein
MLVGKAPPGYRARQRTEVEGKSLEELDKLVEDAGGWRASEQIESRGLRPGRQIAPVETVYWPESSA